MSASLQFQNVLRLARSSRLEDRIGAVCLFVKHCQDDCDVDDYSRRLYSLIGPTFVLKMIQTVEHVDVHRSGVSFLCIVLGNHLLSQAEVTNCSTVLPPVYFQLTSESLITHFSLILRLIEQETNDKSSKTILECLLKAVPQHEIQHPHLLLDLLSEILVISQFDNDEDEDDGDLVHSLSQAAACGLQALFVQCLHGAAPETQRDVTLSHLLDILTCPTLSSSWTIPTGPSRDGKGSFPLFLVSILRHEAHLVSEELAYFLRHTAEVEHSAEAIVRVPRALHVLPVALSSAGRCLQLLFGASEEVQGADEEVAASWAEHLSAGDLLSLRNLFTDMFRAVTEEVAPALLHSLAAPRGPHSLALVTRDGCDAPLARLLQDFLRPLVLLDDAHRASFFRTSSFSTWTQLSALLCTSSHTSSTELLPALLQCSWEVLSALQQEEKGGAAQEVQDVLGEQLPLLWAAVDAVLLQQQRGPCGPALRRQLSEHWLRLLLGVLRGARSRLLRLKQSCGGELDEAMGELWHWPRLAAASQQHHQQLQLQTRSAVWTQLLRRLQTLLEELEDQPGRERGDEEVQETARRCLHELSRLQS